MSNSNCPFCGTKNRPGILFCEDCGRGLHSQTAELTISTRDAATLRERLQTATQRRTVATQKEVKSILLYFRDAKSPVVIDTPKRTLLGRKIGSDAAPDLDLTPFGALEMGVSRLHAAIDFMENGVTITDMNSTNGLYLNGEPLAPRTEHSLTDGDEIHLGRLVAHVYFD